MREREGIEFIYGGSGVEENYEKGLLGFSAIFSRDPMSFDCLPLAKCQMPNASH